MQLSHWSTSVLVLAVAACGGGAVDVTAFTGALLIDGTGAAPVENATMLVEAGRIIAVGPATDVEIPRGAARVDLAGRTIIPGLINAHGHVGGTLGLETNHYDTDNLLRQLELYARYGVTTVNSLGGDGAEAAALRDAEEMAGLQRARVMIAGTVVTGTTPEEAVREVEENEALGVDYIKTRVDDNLGSSSKIPAAAVEALIARAHELNLPVATHIYYLEDAKAVLRAGSDMIAHSVRDQPVDDELVSLLTERDICYSPTLTREVSTFVYDDEPEFFADPFFLREADPAVLDQLRDPARQARVRDNPANPVNRRGLETAKSNLKALADRGVTIAFGTDTGPPARFQGYFEHLELALMAEAGLTNQQIIQSATGDAARCIGRDDIGTLVDGKRADFIVLGASPLDAIENLREIESVWIAGNRVPARGQ